jgi:hypothetical protein
MKKSLILLLLIGVVISGVAQVNRHVAFKYLNEISDTNSLYRDIIATNADDGSWPALGHMQTIKSFYYDYEHPTGNILRMISEHYELSAIKYTEYYIYDAFQNLLFYVYQCENGGKVMKFDGNKAVEIESEYPGNLEINYFIDPDELFVPEKILERSVRYLKDVEFLWGQPNVKQGRSHIADVYKEINSMNNLVERNSGAITGYYNNNELRKIVVKGERIKEFYLENDNLIFAYYPETESEPAIRTYFYNESIFKLIIGKENISREEYEFREWGLTVKSDYKQYLLNL